MVEPKDFQGRVLPTWCPGCGNFGIWNALKQALADLGLAPHEVLLVTGIGCGSKIPDYLKINGLMTIHGRPLPVATGAKLANHVLQVLCVHGDGDGYGIGLGHMIHAMRRNIDLTDLIQNNKVYGLTKGQYSPTSERGMLTSTSPEGALEYPLNPLSLAISAGATFVARGYAGDLPHLGEMIKRAVRHRGYALLDVLQPCVTFNPSWSYETYQKRCYRLTEETHDPSDKIAALKRAEEWEERIPLGILYQIARPTYEEQLPALRDGPLVKQPLGDAVRKDWEQLLSSFV